MQPAPRSSPCQRRMQCPMRHAANAARSATMWREHVPSTPSRQRRGASRWQCARPGPRQGGTSAAAPTVTLRDIFPQLRGVPRVSPYSPLGALRTRSGAYPTDGMAGTLGRLGGPLRRRQWPFRHRQGPDTGTDHFPVPENRPEVETSGDPRVSPGATAVTQGVTRGRWIRATQWSLPDRPRTQNHHHRQRWTSWGESFHRRMSQLSAMNKRGGKFTA